MSKKGPPSDQTAEIYVSDFSNEVPGVTQLLNPQLAALRKAAKMQEKAHETEDESGVSISLETASSPPGDATRVVSPLVTPSAPDSLTLSQCGVRFALIFSEQNGAFSFQSYTPHSDEAFADWRKEFYHRMKLDLKILGITSSFQEFSGSLNPFQKEAFGLAGADFATCVRCAGDPKKIHVLISGKSLGIWKSEIEKILSRGISEPIQNLADSDDFKIELAS